MTTPLDLAAATVKAVVAEEPLQTAMGPWIAGGVWTGVAMLLVGIWRGIPKLLEIIFKREKELREVKAAEDVTLTGRITALEKASEAARLAAQNAQASVVYLTNALSLTLNALQSVDPANPAIKQAKELVAMAVSADDGFGNALGRLAGVPGVGE